MALNQTLFAICMLLKGVFNICDKVILAIEILEYWRKLFKHGIPLRMAIDCSLNVWKRCRQICGALLNI